MDALKATLDFWSSYSIAVRVVIFLAVTAVLLIWFFLLPWLQTHSPTNSKTSSEETALRSIPIADELEGDTSILPSIRIAKTRDEMRSLNGVRELTNSENELTLYRLPEGVFGWVKAFRLNSPTLWVENSLFGPDYKVLPSDTQLCKSKQWADDVEIHKDKEGTVRVLAFVNDSARIELLQPERTQKLHLLLTFREYEEYSYAVAIPRERIESFHHRSFADGETVADAWVV